MQSASFTVAVRMIWMDSKRERWRPAMSLSTERSRRREREEKRGGERIRRGEECRGRKLTEGVDGGVEVGISVFSIHIMSARSTVVLHPDAEVLHVVGVLLGDLVDIEDLASGLLHLSHLVHEIPETRLGQHLIGCEDFHAVGWRVLVTLGRSLATHDLI